MSKKKKQAKKTTQVQQQSMTPEKYLTSGRARKLPHYECWISKSWQSEGLCSLIVARKHTTGNVTYGIYLMDIFCLGLKNTSFRFNQSNLEYQDMVDRMFASHPFGKEPIDYALAHNIIFGAIAYAEDLGFKPEKDWALSQFILEEDTEDVELIDLEFGKNGKPLFINGPYDNVTAITAKLDKAVGKGNYEMTMIVGDSSFDNFLDEDYEDGYDDDDEEDDDGSDVQDADYEEVK
jgi:hypothetical protein